MARGGVIRATLRAGAVVVAVLAVAATTRGALAASTLTFQAVAVRGPRGDLQGRIYAGSEPVITLVGRGAESVRAAEEVARRLNALAEEGLRGSEISLWTEPGRRLIVARGQRIVTVDAALARAHGSDLTELARAWTENLRAVFSRPYLAMGALTVPVGESRAAALRGNIVGEVQVRLETPLAAAAWDEATGVVRVSGLQEGETQLVVFDEANLLLVPLRVMKYAARWLPVPVARVTGNPAPREVVARAIRAAAAASMVLEPGAWGRVSLPAEGTGPLPPGGRARQTAQLAATGPRYLPCRRDREVVIRNEPLPMPPPTVLMVSNSPEKLAAHGLWFEGRLHQEEPARLLYHHVNATAGKADLVVELWNPGQEMAFVHVMEGTGGPSFDEAWAGHRAAAQFLQTRALGAGWVAPVPAGMAVPVVAQPAAKGATVSGVLEFRVLGPQSVSVRVYLSQHVPERLPRMIPSYQESPLLGQWHYSEPQRELRVSYVTGGAWAFVSIGRTPTPGRQAGEELRGSYGVIYEIELELSNPTGQEARVAVAMEPAGGPARAAALVDGRLVEVAMLRPDSEPQLGRWVLGPGEVRRVRITTMPQAGSNYPVRLVARPA